MTSSDIETADLKTEIVEYGLDRDQLREEVSFADALRESGLAPEDMIVVLDPNQTLNKDKDALLGVRLFIRDIVFVTDKDTEQEFANIWLVTEHDDQYRITDGGTGIYKDAQYLIKKYGRTGGFMIARGLRKSDYFVEVDGKKSPATTYYLDV